MNHPPTPEQQNAIDVASSGESFVIEALAGTGKTSTLAFVANAMPTRNVTYVAFNKSIVNEAQDRMPANVTSKTAHGLAYGAKGRLYAHRLRAGRMRSQDIARELRITPFSATVLGGRKVLAAGFLGGLTLKAVRQFCMTADPVIGIEHVPLVPGLDEPDFVETSKGPKMLNRAGPNHRLLCEHMRPYLAAAWRDIENPKGRLPFDHNFYLKLWQLDGPSIYADTILYDEAQDANPCMLDIISSQTEAQLVFVGDSYQQIYSWNGAVNALARAIPDAPRTHLTESFRFGPNIALYANKALAWLNSPYELKGRGEDHFVGSIAEPDATLFRTNGAAVATALRLLKEGRKVALVGGAADVVSFARAAEQLKNGQRVQHPDIGCFESWGEVQDYVDRDPNGSDLKVLVDLVDEYGADMIIEGLDQTVEEKRADVVLSTAHKAKGREWDSVALHGDFPDPNERDLSDEDVRLLYVAATRPRKMLDPTRVGFFDFQHHPETEEV